jgi:hypothetical protein
MKIVAKTRVGSEFLYDARSAHKVSQAKAEKIRDVLNSVRYGLKDGEAWYIYDADTYSTASVYAEGQSFRVYRGTVRRFA